MTNDKKIFIGIGILVVLAIGATFAWWMWSTTEDQKTNVSLTVDGMTINYDAGDHIVGANLIPVSSKEKGAEDGTGIYKEIKVSAPMTTYLNLYMTLEEFPTALAEESMLYEITKDGEIIISGNFSELVEGDRVQLLNRAEVNSTESIFKLYIWIDGNQTNPTTMMNQNFKFVLSADGTSDPIPPLDTSGANKPNTSNGLIPVMYSNNAWVKADSENKDEEYKWYDYNAKQWANAVLVSSTNRTTHQDAEVGAPIPEDDILAYYVWIPRYKYKVWNITKTIGTDSYDAQTTGIDIVFEEGIASTGTIECEYNFATTSGLSETCTGANGDYYTHPAFKFGDTDVEGIWVGKFEISTPSDSTCYTSSYYDNCENTTLAVRVKPNANPWRYNYVDYFSTVIQNMDNVGNEYGLATNSESHMLKNMEWGAVAYLTYSNYGRYGDGTCSDVLPNSYNEYRTGCGPQSAGEVTSGTLCNEYTTELGQSASTTGNIYGIYDMSGGAYEYVMGNMSTATGTYTYNQGDAQTSYTYSSDTAKYIDTYAYGTINNDQTAFNRARLGDGTGEVTTTTTNYGWYSDYAYFVFLDYPWLLRGGLYNYGVRTGVFNFNNNKGGSNDSVSARAALLAF